MRRRHTKRDQDILQILEYIAVNTRDGLAKADIEELQACGEAGAEIIRLHYERHPR